MSVVDTEKLASPISFNIFPEKLLEVTKYLRGLLRNYPLKEQDFQDQKFQVVLTTYCSLTMIWNCWQTSRDARFMLQEGLLTAQPICVSMSTSELLMEPVIIFSAP